jgi:hypothetical protein
MNYLYQQNSSERIINDNGQFVSLFEKPDEAVDQITDSPENKVVYKGGYSFVADVLPAPSAKGDLYTLNNSGVLNSIPVKEKSFIYYNGISWEITQSIFKAMPVKLKIHLLDMQKEINYDSSLIASGKIIFDRLKDYLLFMQNKLYAVIDIKPLQYGEIIVQNKLFLKAI